MNKLKHLVDNKNFYILLIIILSFSVNYYSGFRGVFPIDSFLIFDSGYKVLNNYYPFKDYWSITGPFLDYIQYIFFSIFGVNWKTYIFHAAIINTLLSLVTFFFFNQIGLRKSYSLIYSLSICLLGYPSSGTPFMDHHASIFSLIALMTLILALKKNSNFYWYALPLILGISFFSKQIPSAYFFILFAIVIFLYLSLKKFKDINFLIYLLLGSLSFIIIILIVVNINNISIKNIYIQYILYPLSIGQERGESLNLDLNNVFLQFKFIYFSLLLIPIPLLNLLKIKIKKNENLIDILILITFLISIIVFLYSQLMTKNQILIFFLIPFCLGLTHYFFINYSKNKGFIYFLIFILIVSTTKFHIRFNVDKKFMELNNINLNQAIDGKILDTKLNGLKWITKYYPNNPNKEIVLLKDVKKHISKEKKVKIIISDYQILPAISGVTTFAPNKWFDDLSVPSVDSSFFNYYKNFFLENIKRKKIKVIFVVGENKINYIDRLFMKKDCISKKQLNEISFKLDISNCKETL